MIFLIRICVHNVSNCKTCSFPIYNYHESLLSTTQWCREESSHFCKIGEFSYIYLIIKRKIAQQRLNIVTIKLRLSSRNPVPIVMINGNIQGTLGYCELLACVCCECLKVNPGWKCKVLNAKNDSIYNRLRWYLKPKTKSFQSVDMFVVSCLPS